MTSRTEGFAITSPLRTHSWAGMVSDVWQVSACEGAYGEYVSPYPRLFVILEEDVDGALSISNDQMGRPHMLAGAISYIPADVRVWSRSARQANVRHLDLHFDPEALQRRFPKAIDTSVLATPRLMFQNDRLLTLAKLLADEDTTGTLHDLYGDSLALAMAVELFQIGKKQPQRRAQISQHKLNKVLQHIEDNCLSSIRLSDMAELAGLSSSYFSTAFKAATGVSPYQWHMRARVRRAQAQLLAPNPNVSDIAAACGFADQAHMTRVFKKFVGETPAAWQRNRLGG